MENFLFNNREMELQKHIKLSTVNKMLSMFKFEYIAKKIVKYMFGGEKILQNCWHN